MAPPVEILHFSDVLCVWAYVSQVRMDELEATFAGQLAVSAHFVQVFGDARTKLDRGWSTRGGPAGYAEHVQEICGRFGFDGLHGDCWVQTTPRSSIACHVYLRAIGAAEQGEALAPGSMHEAATAMRAAFFERGRDVSQRAELRDVAAGCGLDVEVIERRIDSGEAYAALNRDLDLIREHDVRMSPTLVFNEGRQRLNGNVGYRVIEANVRELLTSKDEGASWC